MPKRPKRPCSHPGCSALVDSGCCDKHAKQRQREQDERRGTAAQRGYNYRWQKYRKLFLSKHPICECYECRESGRVVAATVVDHIIPHKGNDELFWDATNHQAMSKRCHDRKTRRELYGGVSAKSIKPSAIPVTIVCGPPGSGKTTHVNKCKGDNDLVIDLDEIRARLSGLPWYQSGNKWIKPALIERNKILTSLHTDTAHNRAWFIVSAPKYPTRREWRERLQAEDVVVLAVSPDVCVERIQNDERREMTGETENAINYWWKAYVSGRDEVELRN